MTQMLAGTIPNGTVVVTFLVDSDLTPAVPPGTVRFCGEICAEWYLGSADHRVTVDFSMLSPEPNAHTGRVAFLVEGGSLRLLGRATAQPQGQPLDLASVPFGDSDVIAVHGWLRNGPPLPCESIEPILGLDQIPLSYGCSGTWLQPSADDPGASPGGFLMPPGSIKVRTVRTEPGRRRARATSSSAGSPASTRPSAARASWVTSTTSS